MQVGRRSSTGKVPPPTPPKGPEQRIRGNLLLHFVQNLEPYQSYHPSLNGDKIVSPMQICCDAYTSPSASPLASTGKSGRLTFGPLQLSSPHHAWHPSMLSPALATVCSPCKGRPKTLPSAGKNSEYHLCKPSLTDEHPNRHAWRRRSCPSPHKSTVASRHIWADSASRLQFLMFAIVW
jgi:hypothetical protein